MPKYYRFRATTPTRKPKRSKEKEKEREIEKSVQTETRQNTFHHAALRLVNSHNDRTKFEAENNWLNLTLSCTPAPSWYLRRTSWRESPPLMGLPRQLATGLRASLQLSNRPIFVFKIPAVKSEDVMRPF